VNVELGSTRPLHDGAQITLAPSRVGTATITLHRGGAADAHVHLTPAEARCCGRMAVWTAGELLQLRTAYDIAGDAPVDLTGLARLLGRNRAKVCRKARSLGFTNLQRKKRRQCSLPFKQLKTGSVELRALQSKLAKARIAKNGHPRGALGMRHTPEARAKISARSRKSWADPKSGHHSEHSKQASSDSAHARFTSGRAQLQGRYSRCAGGKRADLGDVYFRSSWEANYARYLNWLRAHGKLDAWSYEAKTFIFAAIKRGTRAYTPDFLVTIAGRDEWHEVKGWMDPKSVTRLRRMAKYFPREVVRVIGESWFRAAYRSGLPGLIPGWEGNKRGNRGA
jgi:hypothetical protein